MESILCFLFDNLSINNVVFELWILFILIVCSLADFGDSIATMLPHIIISDPSTSPKYAKKDGSVLRYKGPLVTFEYFSNAIERATAVAEAKCVKAAREGHPLDYTDDLSIKGRPWNPWIQKEEGEKGQNSPIFLSGFCYMCFFFVVF
jgi:hypothetical protein